jgi:hypothetical protein
MVAKIYKPVKTAMQSGKGNTKKWLLEYEAENSRTIDPIMGWVGNSDPKAQLKLRFASAAEAEKYAQAHKIAYIIIQPKTSKLKKQAYAANFL